MVVAPAVHDDAVSQPDTTGPARTTASPRFRLVLAGVLWLVLTLIQQNTKRQHTTTATTTDAQGRQASTQRTTESDPPAPPAV